MTIQEELLVAMKVFTTRLDDATKSFRRSDSAGRASDYLSTQTILLTDLNAALCNAVVVLANRLDALENVV